MPFPRFLPEPVGSIQRQCHTPAQVPHLLLPDLQRAKFQVPVDELLEQRPLLRHRSRLALAFLKMGPERGPSACANSRTPRTHTHAHIRAPLMSQGCPRRPWSEPSPEKKESIFIVSFCSLLLTYILIWMMPRTHALNTQDESGPLQGADVIQE